MDTNPNRCRHCWSSLPPAATDFCPHCGRTLALKTKGRRWAKPHGEATPPAGQTPAPPAPPAPAAPAPAAYEPNVPPAPPEPAPTPYQPYEPYAPPAPPEPADTPYESYAPPAPAAPPAPPAPAYEPDESYAPPVPPAPAPSGLASYPPPAGYPPPAADPAPAAVAVLERDPAEFPGQPLPPDFFTALPERARRAPRKLSRKLVFVAIVGVGIVVSAIGQWADRNDALTSPARHLVAGACAEYRDFTTRLDRDGNDLAAVQEGMVWFQNNGDRFVEAARLDPGLQPAADFVVWFNGAMEAGFETIENVPQSEIDEREEPLTQACYFGPGRA